MKQKFTNFLVLMLCVLFCNTLLAQVSGTVFQDFNGNGIIEAGELGMPGVQINAYNAADVQVASTTFLPAMVRTI